MKLPYHLPFKTQLFQHQWETGKFNSRFDHRRFDTVLFENLVMARRHSPNMMGSWGKTNRGRLSDAKLTSDHAIKYVKREGRPLRIEFDYSADRFV